MELTKRDRQALIILGVVAVLGGLVWFLFLRGGEADEETAPTPTVSPSPTVPLPPVEDEVDEEAPPRFTFFGGRDPFEPLIVPPSAANGGTDGTTNGTTDGTTNGGTNGTANGDDDGPPGDGGQRESIKMGGRTVTLIDIFTRRGQVKVQVQVDGETFVVEPGEEFAGNFKLVSVQGGCANFVFGDQSFTLCEPGERK